MRPTPARMNEKSPSWARVNPVWMELLVPCPDRRVPKVLNSRIPITAEAAIRIITGQYCAITAGSTIIPTETKKIAPKRSLILPVSDSIRFPSMVSESMDPITNAPRAELNPARLASTTIVKQSPMLTIIRISSLRNFFAFLRIRGMR